METEMLKTVLVCGIKATSKMTDCMIALLPEGIGQKTKLAGTSLIHIIHEITGDMLEHDSEKADDARQTRIPIE